MNKRIIQIDELAKRMRGFSYIDLITGEYIPMPLVRFRESDLKDLIPAPKSRIKNLYIDPKVSRSRTWLCHQVPDIYFKKGAWYDLPIPYDIYEPAFHFCQDNLIDLIPTPHPFIKNLYREPQTGVFYDIPDYFFQKDAFDSLILVPHYGEDDASTIVKFLNIVIGQYPDNGDVRQEINLLFTLTDDTSYLRHEFDLFLSDNKLSDEWRSFAGAEEKLAHEKMKGLAIQWCEKNGLKYEL